jgi:hypothetical protein
VADPFILALRWRASPLILEFATLLTVRCGSSTKKPCAQSAQCWWVVRCGAARGSGFSAFETGASYRFQEQPCALALVGALHDNYNPQDSPSMRVYRLRLAKNVKIWNF